MRNAGHDDPRDEPDSAGAGDGSAGKVARWAAAFAVFAAVATVIGFAVDSKSVYDWFAQDPMPVS